MNLIPVLTADDNHLRNGEEAVDIVKSGHGTCTTGTDHGSTDLEPHTVRGAAEETVQKGLECTCHAGIVDRASDDDSIGLLQFGSNLIDTVVKYAFARLLAFVTRDATVNLQMSYVDHLCLDALLMQSGGHFGECAVSTARSVGTAINKKYFHIYKPIF